MDIRFVDYALRNVVLEVAVERLVFAVLDLQFSEVAAAVLSRQRSLLHVQPEHHVFLFLFQVEPNLTGAVVAVLLLERALRSVIRDFAHALGVDTH